MNEHIQIAKIQSKIIEHLGLTPEQAVFEFKSDGGETILNLITVNPIHDQSFLFKTVKGSGRVEILEKMLEYVESTKDKENSYTIQWSFQEDRELHTSYFRGSNIYDVLHKFHFARDMNTTMIYSIVLSPIS